MDVKDKLRSRRGESLGEVLVGLLIAALGVTMLAGAIMSASGMIRTSESHVQNYYERNNRLEERAADAALGVSQETGTVEIQMNGTTVGGPINVRFYTHSEGGVDIAAYQVTP